MAEIDKTTNRERELARLRKAAERKRRLLGEAAGDDRWTFRCPMSAMASALTDLNLLGEWDQDDKHKVSAAFEKLVGMIVKDAGMSRNVTVWKPISLSCAADEES